MSSKQVDFVNNEVSNIEQIQSLVLKERFAQYLKWGNQSGKPDFIWIMILMEEFGETVAEIMFGDVEKAKTELIQMTAVSNAWAEAVTDRGIAKASKQQENFATAIYLMFVSFGELSKAMLEEKFEDAVGITHKLMGEVYFIRKQIEQDFLSENQT